MPQPPEIADRKYRHHPQSENNCIAVFGVKVFLVRLKRTLYEAVSLEGTELAGTGFSPRGSIAGKPDRRW